MKQIVKNAITETIGEVVYAHIDGPYMADGIKGCPMGRGADVDSAVADLQYRVKIESQVDLVVVCSKDRDHARFEDAFSQVQDPDDWKAPIDTVVDARQDLELVRQAIVYFTATVPTFSDAGDGQVRVQADGYRMGPAGDH
jgi:hypothetical protein